MRILLVDDDKLLMNALAERLMKEHYVVDVVTTGEEAWNYLAVLTYDLAVLDVMLPDENGVNLCQRLRAQGYNLPILLLTARRTREEIVQGLNAGADDYVVKPFDFNELAARIRALLRRERQALPPILAWGELRLDTNTCEATYAQQPLSLTPKEYELLELFLRHPTRVYNPDTIIESLWSLENPPGEEAVRTHIKGVRHKLKQVGAPRDLIKTVYGIGYRLKPEDQSASTAASEARASASQNAKTLAAVARTWEQFKGAMTERLNILEQAAQSLAHDRLSRNLHEQAIAAAHKLAGSLGSFGFPEGSTLARELEEMLRTDVSSRQASQVGETVKALERVLERRPFEIPPHHPLLLIVNDDAASAHQWAAQAAEAGLRSAIASSTQAQDLIRRERPAAVLLQLASAPVPPAPGSSASEELALLAHLHHQLPRLPIVVVTEEEDAAKRLEIVRQGARILLTPPVTPVGAVQAVTSVLKRSGAGAKVMIVDDDEQILAGLQAALAPWGFQLTTLANPQRFWEVLAETAPDLLVLDVEMPEVNGIELCQVLRSEPRWSRLPVLFLTVHQDAATQYQAFAIGADDYVTKPVMGVELANRILNRLERSRLLA
ncbi:MAG: response regulator [Cyanophyceae cyanobacterium]